MKKVLLVVLLLVSLVAAKEPAWQTGTVASFERQTMNDGTATPPRIFRLVIVQGTTAYYFDRILESPLQRDPVFTEGENVRFRLDKNKAVALEDSGREFKMKLIKKRRLEGDLQARIPKE